MDYIAANTQYQKMQKEAAGVAKLIKGLARNTDDVYKAYKYKNALNKLKAFSRSAGVPPETLYKSINETLDANVKKIHMIEGELNRALVSGDRQAAARLQVALDEARAAQYNVNGKQFKPEELAILDDLADLDPETVKRLLGKPTAGDAIDAALGKTDKAEEVVTRVNDNKVRPTFSRNAEVIDAVNSGDLKKSREILLAAGRPDVSGRTAIGRKKYDDVYKIVQERNALSDQLAGSKSRLDAARSYNMPELERFWETDVNRLKGDIEAANSLIPNLSPKNNRLWNRMWRYENEPAKLNDIAIRYSNRFGKGIRRQQFANALPGRIGKASWKTLAYPFTPLKQDASKLERAGKNLSRFLTAFGASYGLGSLPAIKDPFAASIYKNWYERPGSTPGEKAEIAIGQGANAAGAAIGAAVDENADRLLNYGARKKDELERALGRWKWNLDEKYGGDSGTIEQAAFDKLVETTGHAINKAEETAQEAFPAAASGASALYNKGKEVIHETMEEQRKREEAKKHEEVLNGLRNRPRGDLKVPGNNVQQSKEQAPKTDKKPSRFGEQKVYINR